MGAVPNFDDIFASGIGSTVDLPREVRNAIKAEFERTGFKPRLFVKGRTLPPGLDARTINRWLTGTARSATTHHLTFVIDALALLPSLNDLPDGMVHASKSGPRQTALSRDRVKITEDMRMALRAEQRRTGLNAGALATAVKPHVSGLTRLMIQGVRQGQTGTMELAHWQALMNHLRNSPDTAKACGPPIRWTRTEHPLRRNHRPITNSEYQTLRAERQRTGLGADRLFRLAADPPKDLNASMVRAWLDGATRSAEPHHLSFIMDLYRSLPDSV